MNIIASKYQIKSINKLLNTKINKTNKRIYKVDNKIYNNKNPF